MAVPVLSEQKTLQYLTLKRKFLIVSFIATVLFVLLLIDFMVDLKQYWVRNLPDVTKQCSINNLIPSLLFKDREFPKTYLCAPKVTVGSAAEEVAEIISSNKNELCVPTVIVTEEKEELSEKDQLMAEIHTEKENIITFQEEINSAVQKLEKVLYKFYYPDVVLFFYCS